MSRTLIGSVGCAGSGPSWLPAEPSTQSMAAAGTGGGSHDDAMHGAHAHDDHSESEDGGATSHVGAHASQQMHGFRLQPPMQRYPYHGMVRPDQYSPHGTKIKE